MNAAVYIVIGGSKGIGWELVKQLAQLNVSVIATYHESDVRQLEQHFPQVQWAELDLQNLAGTMTNLTRLLESCRACEWILFLNAGTYAPTGNKGIRPQQVKTSLTVNMLGMTELLTHLINQKKNHNAAIRLIHSSSVFAFLPNAKNSAYSSAKAGASHFLQCLAGGNYAITSHIVYLGPIATETALQYRKLSWKGVSPEKTASFLKKVAKNKKSSVHFFPFSAYILYLLYCFTPNRWLLHFFHLLEPSNGKKQQ